MSRLTALLLAALTAIGASVGGTFAMALPDPICVGCIFTDVGNLGAWNPNITVDSSPIPGSNYLYGDCAFNAQSQCRETWSCTCDFHVDVSIAAGDSSSYRMVVKVGGNTIYTGGSITGGESDSLDINGQNDSPGCGELCATRVHVQKWSGTQWEDHQDWAWKCMACIVLP